MALTPSREAFITCALTGAGDTTGRSDKVPVTPVQIAEAGIEAARAGAAILHVHVRDPETGQPARDPALCTLDCGTMNFGEGDYIMTNTPAMLAAMAKRVQALGVRPEIEIFDTGHLVLAKWLAGQGLIDDPVMVQLCMGIPWGAPDDIGTLMSMVNNLPEGWTFSAFSISRNQLPYVALALLAGGNIRVGLEDNLWLDSGVLATNADLVERAVGVAENMGVRVLGPEAVREKLALRKR